MSNIYIQEPPTNGKVLLKTTVGDIDIELWSKEAPLACKNFIQLCLDGYYDNCKFHRLVKGFIVQTGDPSGTGFGGESMYGKPFKDEFHSRLRFVRRGLVAMANGGEKDDNGSQFFFTLESAPELQNKHTIFGKVTGKTLYNMLKLGEGDVDRNERPLYPHKIISTEILSNSFPELEPRIRKSKKMKIDDQTKREQTKEEIKKKSKNFALLSFGEEAEQEEEEIVKISKEFKNKSKSSHDLLKNDDKLSSIPVVNADELSMPNSGDEYCQSNQIEDNDMEKRLRLSNVKEKLNAMKRVSHNKKENTSLDDDMDEAVDFFGAEQSSEKNKKIEKAKDEFKKLQKQILKDIKKTFDKQETEKSFAESETSNEFDVETNRFKEKSQKIKKKGKGREEQCWEMLEKFQNRLKSSKQNTNNEDDIIEESDPKDSWLIHRMQCKGDDEIVLARDANIRNEEDWFDIHDPRNPINQRKRNENKSN